MTIYETLDSPEETIRKNKAAYMKKYREQKKERFNRYQKRYYQSHREEINDKRAKVNQEDRRCLWCGTDISHVRPRHAKFCNMKHGKLHSNKRKKDWYRANQSKQARALQEAQKLQRAKMPVGQS